MLIREASAPHFYAGDCVRSIERFLAGFSAPELPGNVVAAIVPHAGWPYSGAVAARVFASIRRKSDPTTFIILGAVHRWGGINAIDCSGGWTTPLGVAEIDEELACHILEQAANWTVENRKAHSGEHSIEVELPFLKYFFPEAKFVPIAVNPDARAVPLGRRIGEIVKDSGLRAVIVGSTDLTHYGDPYYFTPAGYGPQALAWLHQNDARIVRLAEQMKAEEILEEVQRNQNACGAGAMAATIAAAKVLGAERGYQVEYTTSFDVAPDGEFRVAVGYAGLLF